MIQPRFTRYDARQVASLLLAVALCAVGVKTACADDAADQQYAVAAAHYAQARWELAISEFEKFLHDYPGNARASKATFYSAEAHVQLGRYAAASKLMQQCLQLDPHGPLTQRAMFRAGEAAYLADLPDAAQLLEQYCSAYPDDKLNAYALCYRGDLAVAAGNWKAAQEHYRQQLAKFPSGGMHGESQFGLARALSEQGKSAEATSLLGELAGSKSPLAADAGAYLASLQYGSGNYQAALAACQAFSAPAQHPRTTQVELLWAQSLHQLGQHAEAQQRLERLIATLEKSATDSKSNSSQNLLIEAQLWLGLSLKAQQHYAKAAALLQTVAERNAAHPLAPTIRFHAAEALVRGGDYAAAEKLLQTDLTTGAAAAKDQATPSPAERQQQAARHYLLALALQGQKRHAEALLQLDGLKDYPQAGDLLTARTVSLVALGRSAEAIDPLADYIMRSWDAAKTDSDRAALTAPLAELCVLQARGKQFDAAHATFAQFQETKPSEELRTQTVQRLADSAYQAGNFDWSRELFAALGGGGSSPPVKTETATSVSQKAPDDAAVLARSAATSETTGATQNLPSSLDALTGLAWSQYRANDFAAAAETFGKLGDQYPDDSRAAEFAWLRGQALQRAGKLDEALAVYLALLQKPADARQTPQVLLAAARLHEQFHQTKEALDLYQRLAKDFATAPELEAGLLNWAWALSDAGQNEAARQLFERLRHDFPQGAYWADATSRLAELYLAAKDYDGANRLADEMLAVKLSEEATQRTLYLKGQIAAASEHWDQVSAPLARLIATYPKSPLCLPAEYWLAEAAYRQKKFEDAGLQFESLAKKTTGRNDAWLAMIPLRRAQVLAQSHQWADARTLAEQIHTTFPEFVQQYEADYLIGRCWAADADFEKARQAYTQVLHSATGGKTETAAMAQWMIGESYFHQRQYDAAIREYLRLEILYAYPHWQAGALLQAGKCHESLGQWKSATDLYTRLLKNYPQTDFTEEAGRRLQTAQQHATDSQRK